MAFEKLLEDYREHFQNSSFELRKGEKISRRLREEMVPNQPGVYLIYDHKDDQCQLVYIGKAALCLVTALSKNRSFWGDFKLNRKACIDKNSSKTRCNPLVSTNLLSTGSLHLPTTFGQFLQKQRQIYFKHTLRKTNNFQSGTRVFEANFLTSYDE